MRRCFAPCSYVSQIFSSAPLRALSNTSSRPSGDHDGDSPAPMARERLPVTDTVRISPPATYAMFVAASERETPTRPPPWSLAPPPATGRATLTTTPIAATIPERFLIVEG